MDNIIPTETLLRVTGGCYERIIKDRAPKEYESLWTLFFPEEPIPIYARIDDPNVPSISKDLESSNHFEIRKRIRAKAYFLLAERINGIPS